MMYFIDFDGTMYDNHAAAQWRIDRLARCGVMHDVWSRTAERIERECGVYKPLPHYKLLAEEVGCRFDAQEFYKDYISASQQFIFDDVWSFLRRHVRDVIVVTYGDGQYQQDKVEASGVAELVREVRVTDGRKSDILNEYDVHNAVFVGDALWHLDDVAEHCAGVTPVRIRRYDACTDDERYDCIHSFNTLDHLAKE